MREKLLMVFKETFPEADFDLKDFESLTINSFEEWDSMGNLNLLMNVESEFNIRLTSEQLSEIKSINEILDILKQR
tara:strand:- start:394 stop:621 length:228 start_codon:yes stop_codon:yes gene_type:complete